MKENLRVAIIQSELIWENPAENRKLFDEKINRVKKEVDLIVLPEMFSTGFSMHVETLAESTEGESFGCLKKWAKQKQACVTGSLMVKENGKYYNRLYFVFPDGTYKTYNKRHLFSLAKEEQIYTAGKEKLIVTYKDWKICPLICYDLRFPVFARNTEDYDLLILVANWPEKRISAWDALLKARAIENMCYTVGVNRVGEDGKGFEHAGHSAIFNGLGEQISNPFHHHTNFTEVIALEAQHLTEIRHQFGFLKDRDGFKLNH
ncbi:MAG: nitrilase family protein [Psychroflexus maritimus]